MKFSIDALLTYKQGREFLHVKSSVLFAARLIVLIVSHSSGSTESTINWQGKGHFWTITTYHVLHILPDFVVSLSQLPLVTIAKHVHLTSVKQSSYTVGEKVPYRYRHIIHCIPSTGSKQKCNRSCTHAICKSTKQWWWGRGKVPKKHIKYVSVQ